MQRRVKVLNLLPKSSANKWLEILTKERRHCFCGGQILDFQSDAGTAKGDQTWRKRIVCVF